MSLSLFRHILIMKQTSFASLAFTEKKRRTRRERFLAEMKAVVPWSALLAVIEPHYPKSGRPGRQPIGLETMLRIYFMQQWHALSDPAMEDALYEIESMRRFARLELGEDALPDETTLLKFRHLLERHGLTARMMETINNELSQQGLLLSGGTMVDATIIHAAPSTKNKARERDPERRQTKKGNQRYFGLKIHVGADVQSGRAHTVGVTAANTADISALPHLLREEDQAVFGDKGYVNNPYKRDARKAGMF
jgi:IS5 family transposase